MKLSKRVVVVLVIVAIVLAVFTLYSIKSNSGDKVSVVGSGEGSTDSGQVGVTILVPEVEDRVAGGGNGE
jgi:hypothetical protein